MLLLYVDDMLIAGDDMKDIENLKMELLKSFSMKDLGAAKRILGMKISRDMQRQNLTLSQEDYIEKVLERFEMKNIKIVSSPLSSDFRRSKKMFPKTEEDIC
ncbi:hypothetical protein L7F22_064088 [Adiantum nelumboides]|nr:hypothetical protein [Adiantum nelumboides]